MPVFRSVLRPLLARTTAVSLLGLCLASPPASAQDAPAQRRPGEILDLQRGETLSPNDLYERLQRQQLILIGEQHDNPEHHAVESLLLEALVTPGSHAVLEMLTPNLPLADLGVTTSKDELEAALRDGTRGWNWDSYGHIYYQILQQGGKLVSGNLSGEEIQAIYRGEDDNLPQGELDSRAAIDDEVRRRTAEVIGEQHCNDIPAERLERMVEIQLARDARMANRLESYRGPKQAVLLSGSYHARKDTGVPMHLKDGASAVLLLVPVENDGKVAGAQEVLSPAVADYIWFTSATEAKDYCSERAAASSAKATATTE
ncbi:hypothetical protein GCM10011348_00880 [Marinobacterium nitratireducens]|uniref:Haem-binding uptake Tiki superfamily ChaN domain-containing protein n=1 Tax=Marinobacterium nitratireducens TaxID=518897 RepID=A0A917Z557_9GAMM|nr:ChaN family lipoprotein [Marinobacterium nitratireducens]GGO75631.1 hypothetical protein GCM10011348_00880 [Marinobacterium nitratireducens]